MGEKVLLTKIYLYQKTVQIVHENAMQYDSSNFLLFLFPSSPLLVAINVFLLFEFPYKVTIRQKVATTYVAASNPSLLFREMSTNFMFTATIEQGVG